MITERIKVPLSDELIKEWEREGYTIQQYFHVNGSRTHIDMVKRPQICRGSKIQRISFVFMYERLEIQTITKFESWVYKEKPTLTSSELRLMTQTMKELGWA